MSQKQSTINRRKFLQVGSITGGGLLLGFFLPSGSALAKNNQSCDHFQPNSFIRIDTSGAITLYVAKQEMGQGVNTSLPMILAEELEVELKNIRIEPLEYKAGMMGVFETGGSQSVLGNFTSLRRAGAAAKQMLIAAAAKKWSTSADNCEAVSGRVIHAISGTSLSYGELACLAAAEKYPEEINLRNVKDFKVIGKGQKKSNIHDIITGKAVYGLDIVLPDMLYASVERCPVMGGKMIRFDDKETMLVPGVVKVVSFPGARNPMNGARDGVAVVATNTWAAIEGRKKLRIEWDEGTRNTDNSEDIAANFQKKVKERPSKINLTRGNMSADAGALSYIEAEFSSPFLTHAPMEPMGFVAHFKEGKLELWGGLQYPDWAMNTFALASGLKKENIQLHLTLMGGAFGRRINHDYGVEAIRIAMQFDKPIKLMWTRADDTQYGFLRPANYHRFRAAIDKKNKTIHSWAHHVSSTPIMTTVGGPNFPNPGWQEVLGGATKDFWYAGIPNVELGYSPLEVNFPRGWYRGVEYNFNVFAIESFMDELALQLKVDPVQLRLSLLDQQPAFDVAFEMEWTKKLEPARVAGVLKLAAEKIGWNKAAPKNHYRGIACCPYINAESYVAHAVEIEMKGTKKFRIKKIVAAIDCGIVIDPEGLRSQMEGGIVFGLGQALKSEITLHKSRVDQSSFADFEVLRYHEMPPVEIYYVPGEHKPSGVGEVAVPTVAPALCNALAAAGYRPRHLPIRKEGFEWG